MFAAKAGAYTSEHLAGAPLYSRLLASPTNIRLGWKSIPGTNTLAYYENLQNYGCKFFMVQAPAHYENPCEI